jgi:hypothetical protein
MTNQTPEAVARVNEWVEANGGSVEHKSYEQVRTEMKEVLTKKE